MVDEHVANHGRIRFRGESGKMIKTEREWLHVLLRKIGPYWTARPIAECLEVHGIALSERTIDTHREWLRPGGKFHAAESDGNAAGQRGTGG